MSTADVALLVGVLGFLGTIGNALVNWVQGRRKDDVELRRLDLEGLKATVDAQRDELDDLRAARRTDREEIADLSRQLDAIRRELRKAHDDNDRLTIAMEAMRKR